MYNITFNIEGGESKTIQAEKGEKILDVAIRAGVDIDAPCSGNAVCGKCKISITSGDVDCKPSRHLGNEEWAGGFRLACDSFVNADATFSVPNTASAYKTNIRTADLSSPKEVEIFNNVKTSLAEVGINLGVDLRLVKLELEEPTLDNSLSDADRVLSGLKATYPNDAVEFSYYALKQLPDEIRKCNFKIYVVIEDRGDGVKIIDVIGTEEEPTIYGLAIDIGTTTVSAVIVDVLSGTILAKASGGNGQIRFGGDVIHRILRQQERGGIKRLQDAVVADTINPLLRKMCDDLGMQVEKIYRICVAGNTTMEHLFLGINADYLRQEPYIPAFYSMNDLLARNVDIGIHPNARLILAPNVGSYVGGDITAGALASMVWNQDDISIFIDLGTNGEIVAGNRDFLMCCACSAGPAFEGGEISCGMRATDGAIEGVTIDGETLEPTFEIIGGSKPIGLCGSGIIDIICELHKHNIISGKGRFIKEGKRIKHDENGIGSYILAFKEDSGTGYDVELNEVDIDNFIKAKGAIFSGIMTMFNMLDMPIEIAENIYVAGGIGSGINIKNAIGIGMLPDVDVEKYKYIGNSSLTGAYSMLISKQSEDQVSQIGEVMTYVELSAVPSYMDDFVAACFLPHTDANLFPSLLN